MRLEKWLFLLLLAVFSGPGLAHAQVMATCKCWADSQRFGGYSFGPYPTMLACTVDMQRECPGFCEDRIPTYFQRSALTGENFGQVGFSATWRCDGKDMFAPFAREVQKQTVPLRNPYAPMDVAPDGVSPLERVRMLNENLKAFAANPNTPYWVWGAVAGLVILIVGLTALGGPAGKLAGVLVASLAITAIAKWADIPLPHPSVPANGQETAVRMKETPDGFESVIQTPSLTCRMRVSRNAPPFVKCDES